MRAAELLWGGVGPVCRGDSGTTLLHTAAGSRYRVRTKKPDWLWASFKLCARPR